EVAPVVERQHHTAVGRRLEQPLDVVGVHPPADHLPHPGLVDPGQKEVLGALGGGTLVHEPRDRQAEALRAAEVNRVAHVPVISWYKRPVRRARARLVALACACALASACAPEACSDREERRLERAVELLLGEPGPTADAAERALIDSGSAAIQYLETGL